MDRGDCSFDGAYLWMHGPVRRGKEGPYRERDKTESVIASERQIPGCLFIHNSSRVWCPPSRPVRSVPASAGLRPPTAPTGPVQISAIQRSTSLSRSIWLTPIPQWPVRLFSAAAMGQHTTSGASWWARWSREAALCLFQVQRHKVDDPELASGGPIR